MPFSAGRVNAVRQLPQSGQAGQSNRFFSTDNLGGMTDSDVIVRDQGKNMENLYGIPGSQGPAINIGAAARAIRGHEAPAVVQIERRIDPQYRVHQRQEQIPGRENPAWMLELNRFGLHGREEIKDPEFLVRSGQGASRYAGGQTTGVGMANTLGSDIGPGSLNESPAPTRIPHVWNDGLNAAAGLDQFSFTQQFYQLFIKHPWLGRVPQPTRGIRSISGVTAQVSTASRVRIPAIFVPSAVG